jgi:membrane dipeptidase
MDIPSMKEGNLTVSFFAACVDYHNVMRGTGRQRQDNIINAVLAFCTRNSEQVELARSVDDIRRIATAGKLAIVLTIEGAQAIEDDLASLQNLWERGVRSIALSHFSSNGWSDSSADVARHGGLSALGRQAIKEMNRLGILIDVSHASDAATLHAVDASTVPLIASHSSARALHDHPRNLTDELIKAIAERGGVIGPTVFPEYIYAPFQEALEVRAAKILQSADNTLPAGNDTPAITTVMRSYGGDMHGKYSSLVIEDLPMPSVDVFIDHIVHIAELVGPQHVCIGTDHGAVRFDIPEWETCAKLPFITRKLLQRGFNASEVGLIMGENVLLLMNDVMQAARISA